MSILRAFVVVVLNAIGVCGQLPPRGSFPSGFTVPPGIPTPPSSGSARPPARNTFIGGISNSQRHCSLDLDSMLLDGVALRLGGLLEGSQAYDAQTDLCLKFGGWSSVQQSLAYLYALDKARDFLPHQGIQRVLSLFGVGNPLGANVQDSCGSPLLGVTQTQQFVTESPLFQNYIYSDLSNPLSSLAPVASSACLDAVSGSSLLSTEPLVGVVGPMSTSATTAVSPLLSVYNIPHVTFWAGSTLFDDLQDYPFLFRTVPSDSAQATAIADLIEHFNWSYVSLFAAEDDEYSGRGFELIRAKVASRQTFCLSLQERFSGRRSHLNQTQRLVRLMKNRRAARVVILYAPVAAARVFLEACELENITDVIFLGSHDWINRLTISANSYASQVPIIGLAPKQTVAPQVSAIVSDLYRDLQNGTLVAEYVNRDPWFRTYIETMLRCRVNTSFVDSVQSCRLDTGNDNSRNRRSRPVCTQNHYNRFVPPRAKAIAESVTAAIYAIGYAAANAAFGNVSSTQLPTRPPNGSEVRRALLDLELPCKSGMCRVFLNGQRTRDHYYVQNIQRLNNTRREARARGGMTMDAYDVVPFGEWTERSFSWYESSTLDLGPFGEFPVSQWARGEPLPADFPTSNCSRTCLPGEQRMFADFLQRCCWSCVPCSGNTVSNTSNSDVCSACPLGFRADVGAVACAAISPQEVLFTSADYLSSVVFAIIGFLLILFTLIYYRCHSEAVLVRASDLELSTLTLIGMLVGFFCIPFVNVFGTITATKCIASAVLPEPIKTFVICTVLVKTKRFDSVFNSMKILSRHKRRRFFLGTPMQVVVIFLLTLVNVILAVLYATINPPSVVRELGLDTVSVYCDINFIWQGLLSGYNCVLLIVCIVLAFLTRKLPEEYNQAQLTYLSSLTGFVVWLGLVPAYFVTGSVLRPLISSLSLGGLLLAFWVCLFLPRIVQMLINPTYRQPRVKGQMTSNAGANASSYSLRSIQPSPISTPVPIRRQQADSPLLTASRTRGATPDMKPKTSVVPAQHSDSVNYKSLSTGTSSGVDKAEIVSATDSAEDIDSDQERDASSTGKTGNSAVFGNNSRHLLAVDGQAGEARAYTSSAV